MTVKRCFVLSFLRVGNKELRPFKLHQSSRMTFVFVWRGVVGKTQGQSGFTELFCLG
jgi:hypothetical protein